MMKKLTCLVAALLLALISCTSALAEDVLNMLSVRVVTGGYLSVIAATDYTSQEDMNFSAQTENGELEISDSLVLRNEGTTWFVILEHNYYQDNSNYSKMTTRILKDISEMIDNKDDGAVVRCDSEHAINIEQAETFRESLKKSHNRTDPTELAATVKGVMRYISENADKLMPNVAVIILTACPEGKVTESMVDEIGVTLLENNMITTHIVVTAGQQVHKKDRELGQRLIDKAKATVGGTGFMTEILKEDEADRAVKRINDAERRKVLMLLDPKTESALGHTLTITQTTKGGKKLTDSVNLPDAMYNLWEEEFKTRTPEVEAPKPIEVTHNVSAPSSSTWINEDYNPPMDMTGGGLSTELLIGIIVGAIVLVLLIVLLLLRLKKNSGKTPDTIYASSASSASGSSSGGTTITLAGNNGSVLKGRMQGGRLTIGRNGAKAMVSVPNDGKLSGLHATFTKQGNSLILTDNGSTNGTKVNGIRIEPNTPTQLQQNDTVALGSTIYTVTWKG